MEYTQLSMFPSEEVKNEVEEPTKETSQMFEEAEWCYQFFDDEPVVFAWTNEEAPATSLQIVMDPNGDSLTFENKGMAFKMFSRPMTESTRELRKQKMEEILKTQNQ